MQYRRIRGIRFRYIRRRVFGGESFSEFEIRNVTLYPEISAGVPFFRPHYSVGLLLDTGIVLAVTRIEMFVRLHHVHHDAVTCEFFHYRRIIGERGAQSGLFSVIHDRRVARVGKIRIEYIYSVGDIFRSDEPRIIHFLQIIGAGDRKVRAHVHAGETHFHHILVGRAFERFGIDFEPRRDESFGKVE